MKIRTDFVTNSSDSSFLSFNIKNKRLFHSLTALGIKFEDVEEGEFDDKMKIVLPSGRSMEIDGTNNWDYPYATDYASISEWLVALLLWEINHPSEIFDDDNEEDKDLVGEDSEYSGFTRELIDLFNNHDITHLDWDTVEEWSMGNIEPDLHRYFGDMDTEMESSVIEHSYGFEGVVGPCIYIKSKNGERMLIDYSTEDGIDYRDDCNGLTFVVTGRLKYYENREEIVDFIEENGGKVSESVSKKTDYLVCNDIESTSSKMKKAKALGIPVLSELTFIRMFAFANDFADIAEERGEVILDDDEINEEAWELTYSGGTLNFVVENGIQPIIMQVWKDGKWISNKT